MTRFVSRLSGEFHVYCLTLLLYNCGNVYVCLSMTIFSWPQASSISDRVTGGGRGWWWCQFRQRLCRVTSNSLTAILFNLVTSNLVCSISKNCTLMICSNFAAVLQHLCSRSAAVLQHSRTYHLTQILQIWYVASLGDSAADLEQVSSRSTTSLQQVCSCFAAPYT